jgi:hypothetical protein
MAERAGLHGVAAVLAAAHDPAADAAPDDGQGGNGSAPPVKALPDGCPVIALGTENGVFYFLTTLGELRGLSCDKVANKHIVGMFAPDSDYLFQAWPRKKLVKSKDEYGDEREEWIVTGWRADDVSIALMDAAAARGVWNAREMVRGRGAWETDDGHLVMHFGNHILMRGRWLRPGMYDGKVYPAQPPLSRPHPDPVVVGLGGPGEELLRALCSWNWRRPSLDARLLLGWMVQARLGDAIEWRALAWVTGDKATGKSTLQKLIKWYFDGALLQSTNATEAGIRQILGQQSLPVAIDEAEASDDNRKLQALLELARQAASGGEIARGGNNHEGHQFVARSAFLFSSIYTPPMLPQDRSRMALLELDELPAGKRDKVGFDKQTFRDIGAKINRIIVDRWHEWPRLLEAYRDALIDYGGQGGRAADQFGTLLAAAHLVLEPDMPNEEALAGWGSLLDIQRLAETAEATDDKLACIQHLMSTPVDLVRGGDRRLVSEWVLQAVERQRPGDMEHDTATRRKVASDALARIGLKVVCDLKKLTPGLDYLALASAHQGLAKLYEGTHWQTRSGAEGVWAQAARRLPSAVTGLTVRIAGSLTKCTAVPLSLFLQIDDPDQVYSRAWEDA